MLYWWNVLVHTKHWNSKQILILMMMMMSPLSLEKSSLFHHRIILHVPTLCPQNTTPSPQRKDTTFSQKLMQGHIPGTSADVIGTPDQRWGKD